MNFSPQTPSSPRSNTTGQTGSSHTKRLRVPPPPPRIALKLKTFLFLSFLCLGALALSFLSTQAKTDEENDVVVRNTPDTYVMEYIDSNEPSTHYPIKFDVRDYWSSSVRGRDHIRVGFNSDKRIFQTCSGSPNCVKGKTGRSNYFDGVFKAGSSVNVHGFRSAYGGFLRYSGNGNTTVAWATRHPSPNSSNTVEINLTAYNDGGSSSIKKYNITLHGVGFKNHTPTVEPKMGYWDQLYLAWDDAVRYQPNNDGYITADSDGNVTANRYDPLEDFGWNYRIRYSDDHSLDRTSPVCDDEVTENCWKTESYWGTHQVSTTNRRYHADIGRYNTNTDGTKNKTHTYQNLLSELYQPETELTLRMWMRQRRFDRYNVHMSNPTRIFLPAEMELTQEQDTIKAVFQNTYTDTIDYYQYRIGTNEEEGSHQTEWESDWITLCQADTGTDVNHNYDGQYHQTPRIRNKVTITSLRPHPSNNCGGNPNSLLQPGTSYRIQLRAVDESRSENRYVRNYVHPDKFTYNTPPTTPPPATAPPTTPPTTQPPTTPATAAPPTTLPTTPPPSPTTQPTTPTATTTPAKKDITTQPTTPVTRPPNLPRPTNPTTQPTQPPNTQAQPPSSSTQTQPTTPQVNTGGLGGFPAAPQNINTQINVTGDNNTVIVGDNNNISFTDTNGHTHETNIGQLASMGVTRGCNPPQNSRFCPDRAVTRGEMATFLTRAFNLPTTNQNPFDDTQQNIHRTNINNMAAAGISRGCNPPENNRFCPDRAVTRGEMATFMYRVLELEDRGDAAFDDTNNNVHTHNIERFATAGITRGCNPPQNSSYCPDRAVTRAEMATFLVRSTSLSTG